MLMYMYDIYGHEWISLERVERALVRMTHLRPYSEEPISKCNVFNFYINRSNYYGRFQQDLGTNTLFI